MTKSKADGGLGFRELNALLTNRVAQVLKELNALWVRVLKGLYFPAKDFLHATRGSRASWGWSNLLTGRDTIRDDGVWSIGNGRSVQSFTDQWVPLQTGFRISHRNVDHVLRADDRVEAWIDRGCWNEDVVRQEVSMREVDAVLSI